MGGGELGKAGMLKLRLFHCEQTPSEPTPDCRHLGPPEVFTVILVHRRQLGTRDAFIASFMTVGDACRINLNRDRDGAIFP
jgi:hypothetical protein